MENSELELVVTNFHKLKKDLFLLTAKNNKTAVLYHRPSLKAYYLEQQYKQFFSCLLNNTDPSHVFSWLEKNTQMLSKIWNELEYFLRYESIGISENVERLTLLISQKCGQNCKYCYAGGGTYANPSSMNFDTVKRALEVFSKLFNYIEKIQFFGGEPLLNINCIEKIVPYVNHLYEVGSLEKRPILNIVTGLGVSKKLIEKLKMIIQQFPDFEFEIVVSFDGPEKIQNYLRPFKGRFPSYEIVKENMDYLQENGLLQLVEVTYTNYHVKNGIKPFDLRSFFYEKFKLENVIIVPVIANDPTLALTNRDFFIANEYQTVINRYQNGNKKEIDSVERLANQVLNAPPTCLYCGSGITEFVVDSEGDVFPCQLLASNKNFLVGNVYDTKEKLRQNLITSKQKYSKIFDKSEDNECQTCFLQFFCRGCPIAPYLLGNSMHIPHESCPLFKEVVKNSILIKAEKDFVESNS
ncbi:radical SAM/SPASM domain-containing protein [Petrotoga sp. SL27]|uniref:radical SAM/SPASM domain-containing protein n=1 Tax=Petrotoga sp. SL27 TaxID=1445612 RepID=UPI000D4ED13C|nr:radical SAM protein [Petrotoga sp. SL27]POZ90679.1 hypothetical protein AD60_05490 [Petrotoga sp. SL27]